MLTKEQAEKIKEQLFKQLESFPEDQRASIESQIDSMTPEQLEQFLVQNKMLRKEGDESCVFCEIINGSVSTFKIDENSDSVAVLEINPFSKGHAIIIPKKHLGKKEIPKLAFELADLVSKKLKEKFNPEKINISETEFLGHGIINVIPVYSGEKLEKKQASKEELESIQKELLKKEKVEQEKKEVKEEVEEKIIYRAPVRYP